MNIGGKRFEVDRANGKLAGVCAGIANMTGLDATVVRIGLVVATILLTPWVLLAYGAAALIGQPKRDAGYLPSNTGPRSDETRERMRSVDLRMQAIETYVTSSNSQLAREIEELRKD
jgi:phage shock protein C